MLFLYKIRVYSTKSVLTLFFPYIILFLSLIKLPKFLICYQVVKPIFIIYRLTLFQIFKLA